METHEDDFFEGTGGYQLDHGLLLEVSETGQDIGYRDTRPAPPTPGESVPKTMFRKNISLPFSDLFLPFNGIKKAEFYIILFIFTLCVPFSV